MQLVKKGRIALNLVYYIYYIQNLL